MTGFNASEIATSVKNSGLKTLISAGLVGSFSVLLLSGCSSSFTSGLRGPSGETVVASIKGKTHGGQFPVTGSTVQVYAVPASGSGYGAAATAIGDAVTTDSSGNWTYGSFSCASGNDELYVVSKGGNPGLAAGTNNPALVLTAALGPCSQVEAGTPNFVFIDEVTTVAEVYALAGFATDYLHIGTSATNYTGLSNAFATANNIVNVTTGQAYQNTPAYNTAPTAPAGSVVPPDTFRSIVGYDVINTLANVIATCVNTDGQTNPSCSNLFQYVGSGSQALPQGQHGVQGPFTVNNTADALLYIAHNPGLPSSNNFEQNNVTNVYNLMTPSAPFGPVLTAAPNEFTVTVNFVGGGLGGVKSRSVSSANQFAIDPQGNLWVPNLNLGTVTELSNLGAPLSPTTLVSSTSPFNPTSKGGYPGGSRPVSAAIDTNGNVWVADANSCVYELSSSGALLGGPYTSACPGSEGAGIAVDGNNNVWIEGQDFINAINSSGNPISANFPYTAGLVEVVPSLGIDYSGNVWFIDTGEQGAFGSITPSGSETFLSEEHFANPGQFAFGPLASSAGGNGGLAFWDVNAGGTQVLQPAVVTGGVQRETFPPEIMYNSLWNPTWVSNDGNANWYAVNDGGEQGNGIGDIPPNISVVTTTALQVSNYINGYIGGSALFSIEEPYAVQVDQSGNAWVLNGNNSNSTIAAPAGGTYLGNGTNAANLTEFIGLGGPVNPVFSQDVKNQSYATLP